MVLVETLNGLDRVERDKNARFNGCMVLLQVIIIFGELHMKG